MASHIKNLKPMENNNPLSDTLILRTNKTNDENKQNFLSGFLYDWYTAD